MPGKWRPTTLNCLYVIPNLGGGYQQLSLIFDRILPLRKSDGGSDRLVIMGGYFDSVDSCKVLDRIIKEKNKNGSRIVFMRGPREEAFLRGIEYSANSDNYIEWMKAGGEKTLAGYLRVINFDNENPYVYPRQRIGDIIPIEHIDIIKMMVDNCVVNGYAFGCEREGLISIKNVGERVINDKEIVLVNEKVMVAEIESMECFEATPGYNRLVRMIWP